MPEGDQAQVAPSARMVESARVNGALGGRPTNREALIQRAIRERTRKKGSRSLVAVVAFWVDSLGDTTLSWSERNRAAENLANRFGLPPITGNINVGDDLAQTPKIVVHKHFAAPASYSEDPPEEVLEAMRKFAEETRGKAMGAALESGGAVAP